MGARTCVRRLLSILLALVGFARGFVSPTLLFPGHKIARTSTTDLWYFPEDPKEDINGEDKDSSSASKARKQRCADYPMFTYVIKQYKFSASDKTKKRIPYRVRLGDTKNGASTNRSDEASGTSSSAEEASFSDFFFESDILKVARSARKTRLLNDRTYAKKDAFEPSNLNQPPNLQDLTPPTPKSRDTIWISTPARLASFFVPYFGFPYLIKFLDHYVTMQPAQLDEITSKFGPGVAILYGTFVSLTLSILYNRQQNIQENVAIESSLLGVVTRNLLHIFRRDGVSAVEAGQCTADQIRTLVRGSRGQELMLLMYSDPYARMIDLVEYREEELLREQGDLGVHGTVIGNSRDIIKDLFKIRASRLSDEALALPPTHFFILTVITGLILFGYSVTVLPTVDSATGVPSNESSLLFGCLCAIYVLFYNFTRDMNDPFGGLYQVRRSSTASHLLQLKWLLVNHPLLRGEVDFEAVEDKGSGDVLIRTPGIGDMYFEKDEIYPDGEADNRTEE